MYGDYACGDKATRVSSTRMAFGNQQPSTQETSADMSGRNNLRCGMWVWT